MQRVARHGFPTIGLARLITALAVLMALAFGAQALSADESAQTRRELGRVTEELQVERERIEALKAEIEAMGEDGERLDQALIDTAAAIQDHERELTASEDRLARLGENESGIRESLDARREVLAALLAAMQRLGRDPPPALVVRPEDALASVRAALLMGAVLPELRIEAEALASDLGELTRLKERMAAERDSQEREIARLAEERERVELLLAEREERKERSGEELETLQSRATALAAQARDLEELVAGMDAEQSAPGGVPTEASALAPAAGAMAALRDGARIEPSQPFAAARGNLSLPAAGVRVRGFGDEDEFGGRTQGQSIATRSGAQVTAPADGWVVYAGPFRSYGQLLIINPGGGYHILLAGMERISVELGQFVLAGEPVAVMGGRMLASAAAFVPGSDQPVLYVEFRKDGSAIDPSPWWASRSEKVPG